MLIQHLQAREILDSRGIPTVEASLWTDTGIMVTSSVPAGTSIGKHEVKELRDQDAARMHGDGVLRAVQHVNETIAPRVIGMDVTKQTAIDQLLVDLDGTPDKSKLGANAILAVSQVVLKAGAASVNMPLFYYVKEKYQLATNLQIPTPIFTLVNGGVHGASNLDIQEFQVIPASHLSFSEGLNVGVEIYRQLEEVLKAKGAIHSIGIGGGYAPNLFHNIDVFEILIETVHNTQFTFSRDLFFGVDVSADTLLNGSRYTLKDRSQPFTTEELLEFYDTLRKTYHVISIEDGYAEDAWSDWKKLTEKLGETTMIVADNLVTTNKERLLKSIEQKACNAILIKPNQIGTISETVEVVKITRDAGMKVIISHRSGETNDDFIADIGVGLGADYVKFGAPARGERVAKYNRLLMIQDIIQQSANQTV